MALQFNGYGRDPGEEIRKRWSGTLDGIFENYLAAKDKARQNSRQDRADTQAADDRANAEKDRQVAARDKYGFDPRQAPEGLWRTDRSAPIGPEYRADRVVGAPEAPGSAPGPKYDASRVVGAPEARGGIVSNAPGQGQAAARNSDYQGPEHPLAGPVRDYMTRRDKERSLSMRKTESDIANTEADTAKKLFEARNPRRGTAQGGDKILPATNVIGLNEGQAVSRLLPEVEAALKENASIMGPIKGRIGSANPYNTQAQTVDARFRTASQAFGRFMEGGVLRKEDEEKYRKMFPQMSDTPEVAQNKLSIVRRQLAQKYESDRGALGGAGYDISGASALDIPPSIFGQTQPAQAAPAGGPAVGEVRRGYTFIGGDPSSPSSWRK